MDILRSPIKCSQNFPGPVILLDHIKLHCSQLRGLYCGTCLPYVEKGLESNVQTSQHYAKHSYFSSAQMNYLLKSLLAHCHWPHPMAPPITMLHWLLNDTRLRESLPCQYWLRQSTHAHIQNLHFLPVCWDLQRQAKGMLCSQSRLQSLYSMLLPLEL